MLTRCQRFFKAVHRRRLSAHTRSKFSLRQARFLPGLEQGVEQLTHAEMSGFGVQDTSDPIENRKTLMHAIGNLIA